MLLARRPTRRGPDAAPRTSAPSRRHDPLGRRDGERTRRMAAAVALWRDHGGLVDTERPLVVSDLHAGDGRLSRVLRDAVYYAVDFRGYDPSPHAHDVARVDLHGTLPPGVDLAFLLGGVEALPVRSELADRLAWHARWLVTAYAPPVAEPDAIARREARGWHRHQTADGFAEELASAAFAPVAGTDLDGGELLRLWRQGTS